MSCENCTYFESKGNYSKGYCTYYKSYCYPSDSCSHETSSSSGGCYLTSACIEAKRLNDNCYELETLRNYRDNWLKNRIGGIDDINEYYEIAPKIVESINAKNNSTYIWSNIYNELVEPSVSLIKNGLYEEAYELYKNITLRLKNEFINNTETGVE